MPKFSVHVARFPYGGREHPAVTDWLVSTVTKMKADPRVGEITSRPYDDTPITMTRNLACRNAILKYNADYLLMVDNDMGPDSEVGHDPEARPFWDLAFDTLVNYGRPAVIAAPYCGPPPEELVYVFKWTNRETGAKDFKTSLEMFSREEAAQRGGVEEVAALPTGLILFDVRAIRAMWAATKKPWFEYEMDEYGAEKQSTEDVFCTRNFGLAGIPQLCAWPCWAAHYKTKAVRRPRPLTCDAVHEAYRKAIAGGAMSTEKLVMVGDDKPPADLEWRSQFRRGGILGDAAVKSMPSSLEMIGRGVAPALHATTAPAEPYRAEKVLG